MKLFNKKYKPTKHERAVTTMYLARMRAELMEQVLELKLNSMEQSNAMHDIRCIDEVIEYLKS